MNVLLGRNVDVISPFPARAINAAVGWMYCYKTMVFGDQGPQTKEDIAAFLELQLAQPNVLSWGIVDKDNLTNSKQSDFPLVGVVFFEHTVQENGYVHIASSRKAWGERIARPGLVDQGCDLIKQAIWEELPGLRRCSIATFASNRAARHLAQRLGFRQDGYFEGMGTLNGQAQDIVHFGLMRPTPIALEEATYELGINDQSAATAAV